MLHLRIEGLQKIPRSDKNQSILGGIKVKYYLWLMDLSKLIYIKWVECYSMSSRKSG
jgi:hypothetical protein